MLYATQKSTTSLPAEDPYADLDRLGEEIAELSAHIQAATYRLLVLIREFDQREGWATGFRSCAHWLNWRTGLDMGAAREKVRVARALSDLPNISEAMWKGEISFSKVRALTRVATAENEEELLDFARAGTAAHVEKLVRLWRRVDRHEALEEAEKQHEHRFLRSYTDEDGMLVVRARLEPEMGAVFQRALEAASDALYRESDKGTGPSWDDIPREQRRADALGLVAESALNGELDAGTRGDRYQVVVHVEGGALGDLEKPGQSVLEDGVRVSAETSRRLACDSSKVVMTHGPGGSVLDVGRKTRAVPPALRRALTHRDGGCRFPGCGLRFCDAHHIEHWAEGGKTQLENLVLLCRGHHRAVHEEGFQVEIDAEGEPRFTHPNGWLLPEAPPSPPLDGDPVVALTRRHWAEGLEIDGWTGCPTWEGESCDYSWAIEAMRTSPDPPDTCPRKLPETFPRKRADSAFFERALEEWSLDGFG